MTEIESDRERLTRIERQLHRAASVFLGAESVSITGHDIRWLVRMLRVFIGYERERPEDTRAREQQKSRMQHQG